MTNVTAFLVAAEGHETLPLEKEPSILLPAAYDVVWSLVVFIIVGLLFAKYVIPKFQEVLAEREDRIKGGIERAEVAQKEAKAALEKNNAELAEARAEGDLSENGGYHAAREEQGQAEARIRQLEQMLQEAKVGEAPSTPDEVVPGSKVTVAYFGDEDDTETFLLGSREVMGIDDSVDVSVYSPQAPLGGAVVGHHTGETVSYKAPNGKTIEVKILSVAGFSA